MSQWTPEERKLLERYFTENWSDTTLFQNLEGLGSDHSHESTTRELRRMRAKPERSSNSNQWKESRSDNEWVIESSSDRIVTVDDAIARAQIDTEIWEVDKVVVNGWDITMKVKTGEEEKPVTHQNYQIKIWLVRKVPKRVEDAVETLLNRLRKASLKTPFINKISLKKLPHRHSLEPCIFDPHYGLRCFEGGADMDYSPEECANVVLSALDEIVRLAEPYAPFEEIFLPLGNDFFHTDNVFGGTTKGTVQPEAESFLHTFIGGETLAIEMLDRLKELAPVSVYMIPGNHDRVASFMLGRVLNAYYHNDKNIDVHAGASPFKFHQYGTNLIGYEHGASVAPIRYAALMANECPEGWLASKDGYREWHCGDQHRKGSSKPSMLEEQGVSVEFLPGLCVPNEWHRLKSFNWQKRAAMGFVWDHTAGPVARLQVNIDRYINALMGEGRCLR